MRVSYFAYQKAGNSSEFVRKSNQHFPLYSGRQSLELYITQYNLCVQVCITTHTFCRTYVSHKLCTVTGNPQSCVKNIKGEIITCSFSCFLLAVCSSACRIILLPPSSGCHQTFPLSSHPCTGNTAVPRAGSWVYFLLLWSTESEQILLKEINKNKQKRCWFKSSTELDLATFELHMWAAHL